MVKIWNGTISFQRYSILDPIVQLLTPPLSNTGMNQFDDQTFNQSSQPLQYSRRSLMEGLNNFPQSTTQSSPVHYPNQFHPRSSLPNHLMFNSSQSIVEVGHDPSTSGATSTPSYSSHSNGSNDSQSIPIRSSSFHSTDETPSNTSIFSCLKDLIHGVNSSIESDSWMEIIKPFRSVNPPPPHSLPNHSTPLANSQPAPSHILRLDNAVMANVNQYLPSSEYFNSPILEWLMCSIHFWTNTVYEMYHDKHESIIFIIWGSVVDWWWILRQVSSFYRPEQVIHYGSKTGYCTWSHISLSFFSSSSMAPLSIFCFLKEFVSQGR